MVIDLHHWLNRTQYMRTLHNWTGLDTEEWTESCPITYLFNLTEQSLSFIHISSVTEWGFEHKQLEESHILNNIKLQHPAALCILN